MISVENLSKDFGAGPVIRDVSFCVPEGAFLVLLGPSGCGKSTLLRILAGLTHPSSGTISFGDKLVASGSGLSLPPEERGTGLVFQSYALWPHMSVAGNVEWPLKVAGLNTAERSRRVQSALRMMDIEDLAGRYIGDISGGQQQRTALARMIAARPKVLLFDEPLSNLDAALRVEMRHELARIHEETGATTVYVTHDQIEAVTLATHVAVMNGGVIEQFATPMQLVDCPASAFVAGFVGTPPANLLTVRHGAWFGKYPDPALNNRTGKAMVRAEDLKLSDSDGPRHLPATRVEVIPMAGQLLVTGRAEGSNLTAVVPRGTDVADTFYFVLPERPATVFSAEGTVS